MKKQLLDQYNTIRKTISNNVETISQLFAHSKQLSDLIENITANSSTESQGVSQELKDNLEKQSKAIDGSIKTLIDQTIDLFKAYDQFAEELFASK
jgi:uncharacterized protein YoxC